MLTAGYSMPEIEDAMRQAMDRWRVMKQEPIAGEENTVAFSGSHDIVVTWISSHFSEIALSWQMSLQFVGSLGGLIALAEGRADIAGSHLWDKDSNSFNIPFIRRILPGQNIALITVANRRLGLILPPGNPDRIRGLEDLRRSGLRFINRQQGSGTRVWLDYAISKLDIPSGEILGFKHEVNTHSAVARAIAEGEADVGMGLEAAARSYGLDFIFLQDDRYELVVLEEKMTLQPIAALVDWLNQESAKQIITSLGGYNVEDTGKINWIS
jgi:putative molybdopterin biosynthesis protein